MKRAAAAAVFGCASVLLSYPDDGFAGDVASARQRIVSLPAGATRDRLAATAGWLAGMDLMDLAAAYVDTFDLRRGISLHLTHYSHGDTRERGMALSALASAYRDMGFSVTLGELPDFLPALLELAAVSAAGAALLGEQRMALDALRTALEEAHSRYSPAVAAVCDALPGPSKADRDALRRYRAEGPPSERVGLEPFAPPEVLSGGVTVRR